MVPLSSLIPIIKLGKAHGLKGMLRYTALPGYETLIAQFARFYIKHEGLQTYRLVTLSHLRTSILGIEGINNTIQTQPVSQCYLCLPVSAIPLGPFICHMKNKWAINMQQRHLGKVQDVSYLGSNRNLLITTDMYSMYVVRHEVTVTDSHVVLNINTNNDTKKHYKQSSTGLS